MRLYDAVREIRSKNAGPFTLTIDLICPNQTTFERILSSPRFGPRAIATLYQVEETSVCIRSVRQVLAIKVTLPRASSSSGAPGDRDVYGSQQHFPLADIEI